VSANCNNSVGRITITGQITRYIGAFISGPQGITDGRDGALWFTNPAGNSVGRITTAIISTRSFAGYQASITAGSATSASAQFKVPKLSCTSVHRAVAPAAGVAVNRFATFSAAFLFVGCRHGKPSYVPGLVINGHVATYTTTHFSPGDLIKVYAKVTTTRTTVRITDATKRVTKKRTGPGATSSAAFVGDSGLTSAGKLLGVPNFGALTFTNCLIDGRTLASRRAARIPARPQRHRPDRASSAVLDRHRIRHVLQQLIITS